MVLDDELESMKIILSILETFSFIEIVVKESDEIRGKTILDREKIDILLLDIVMPKFDGFTLLGFLEDKPATIICSAHQDYAFHAHDEGVVDYISKMTSRDRLKKALMRAIEYADKRDGKVLSEKIKLLRESDRKEVEVVWREIRCGESTDKIIDLQMINGNSEKYICSISHFLSLVPNGRIVRVHKSFIVSLDEVDNYNSKQLTLFGGKTLEIGRAFLDDFRSGMRLRDQ